MMQSKSTSDGLHRTLGYHYAKDAQIPQIRPISLFSTPVYQHYCRCRHKAAAAAAAAAAGRKQQQH